MNRREFGALLFVPRKAVVAGVDFEATPKLLAKARSPKFVTRRAHGLVAAYTQDGNLLMQSSPDLGDTWAPPMRINSVAGEVSDHGENSPQLLYNEAADSLHAVWNARDPKEPSGSLIRCSSSSAMRPGWTPAVTVNDDGGKNSHSFQGAAVGPDGAIYAGWLDMRGRSQSDDYTGSGSGVYLSVSRDGGKTFSKNIEVSRNVCPCCRVAFGFAGKRVVAAWRGIEAGDMRDIWVASSSDGGATWSKPHTAMRDGWKIRGCPHVGPSMASIGGKLYMTWFSEAGGKPAVFVAESSDGGETFVNRRSASIGTADPTHPQFAASEDRLGLVFQARAGSGWGKVGIYYREILASGAMTPLQRIGEGQVTSNYPSVWMGMSGRVFVGWSETLDEGPRAYLVRGRRG